MYQEQIRPEAGNKDIMIKRLQGLDRSERLILLKLAQNLGVTATSSPEVFANSLTQAPLKGLETLSETWDEVSRYASDRGMKVADLSPEEIQEALGMATV